MKATDLIKDSLNHSSWRHGFLQNASETKDSKSDTKIVKLLVVKRHPESHAEKEDLMSFEALMLPHLDAAHNLAKWLLRSEQDARDVVQEAYLRAFKSFGGFHSSNGRGWLLTIVRNTAYTLLKKNRAVDFTTTFDEELHAGDESLSPATILIRAEDAELMKNAVDKLPAEFREILILRHQEDLSYKEIGEILKIPTGTVMSRLARARAKLKEYLTTQTSQEKLGELPRETLTGLRPMPRAQERTRAGALTARETIPSEGTCRDKSGCE